MIKKQILDVITRNERFLLAAHINPEGDAIGSQLAMARMLKAMGKTVHIINEHPVPANLMFLPDAALVRTTANLEKADISFDVVIVLDCPSLERIGSVKNLLSNEFIINIDHHISNIKFGDLKWIDAASSSVGEMIYELFKNSEIDLDNESALCIYVAMMTDTGSFRYSNTSSGTHIIVAELLKYAINPTQVYEYIYETKSFETFKLLAEVLSSLKRSDDRKFVWFNVTCEMLKKNNLTAEDTEAFIDFVRMVEGAQVIAFLRETESKHAVKISFRSKSKIDVNNIAKQFGGGGHPAASGCSIEGSIAEAEKLLLVAVKKAIKEQG